MTAARPVGAVTSAQIAEVLEIDSTQIRKDFVSIGLQGMCCVWFDICEVCRWVPVAVGIDDVFGHGSSRRVFGYQVTVGVGPVGCEGIGGVNRPLLPVAGDRANCCAPLDEAGNVDE